MPATVVSGRKLYRVIPPSSRKLIPVGKGTAGSEIAGASSASWQMLEHSPREVTPNNDKPEGYDAFVEALQEAELAARRIIAAYDTSLAHLRECRLELETARGILADSNRGAEIRAATGN